MISNNEKVINRMKQMNKTFVPVMPCPFLVFTEGSAVVCPLLGQVSVQLQGQGGKTWLHWDPTCHVKVTEHHGKLLERILGNAIFGVDLLLQVVTDPHRQLVELVPLLSNANGGVPIVEDQLVLQDSSSIMRRSVARPEISWA